MTESLAPTNPLVEVIKRVQREIQTLKDTAHILTPMARTNFDAVAIGKVPVLRVTAIDPDPDHGEVYPIRQIPGKFALTKVGLMRLEALAGISNWKTNIEYVDSNPLKVKATAYAEITDIDGTVRGKQLHAVLDFTDGSPQANKMIRKNQDGSPDMRELIQARTNIVRLAESKAMNAVRRDLLNLQATFSQAELRKPFVIMRLVDAPLDASDPLIRKLIIMRQLHITSEMYETAAHDLQAIPAQVEIIPPPALPPVHVLTDAEQKEKLLTLVQDLYQKKVRGGRSASKPPLASLDVKELDALAEALQSKPDLT